MRVAISSTREVDARGSQVQGQSVLQRDSIKRRKNKRKKCKNLIVLLMSNFTKPKANQLLLISDEKN